MVLTITVAFLLVLDVSYLCVFLATQPVLSVAGHKSAGAAFGLRVEQWMV